MQMKQSLLRYKYYGSREYGQYYAEEISRYVGTTDKALESGHSGTCTDDVSQETYQRI